MTAQIAFDFIVKPKPRVKRTPQERAVERVREHVCATCGLSWDQGCERPDWTWIDLSVIGMRPCDRCHREVCHHCYARYEGSVLCPACWTLPEPTYADAEASPLAATNGVEYAWWTIQQTLWRYEAPTGQNQEIKPAEVWFWQNRSTWEDDEKESERRFSICCGHAKPKATDRSWLPEWIAA